jgi:hypothetical protein
MLAIERFMGVFFEKRRTSFRVMASSYLLYFVLATAERLVFNTAASHVLFIIPILFIISLNYKTSMSKRLLAIMSNYVLFAVIVNFTVVFIDMLPASLITYVKDYDIGQYTVASLLSYLIAHLLRGFRNIRKNDISTPLFWASALVVPCTTIALLIVNSLNLTFLSRIFSVLFLTGANFLTFYLCDTFSAVYENKLKSALQSQEKEYYLSQCRLMQESLEKMKSYRHDMSLHLATLKDYTTDNKAATDYLNILMGDMAESELYSDTGNIAFDSIINFKLKNTKENDIKPDINLLIPPTLNIEVADIVTIIGNLLDNALDAVAKVEEKIIKLDIKFSKGNLFIQVDNTFDGKVKYTTGKSGEEKRIATLKDGDEHGHGLKNIKKSAEKYNGHVDISHTDSVFTVGILLYVDDVKCL